MERIDGDLEMKVISAKHLWAFNFFQKLQVYASASLTGQEQRTPADPDGDGHPEWDHPMTFHLSDLPTPAADLFLRFELRHEAGLPFSDRTIGEVKVPLADLLHPSDAAFRFVDYQIRSPADKPNGVLHFGYKLNRIGAAHSPPLTISGYPQISDQPPAHSPPLTISGYPQISDQPPAHSPPVTISGYPQISDQPPALYPAANQWEDTHAPAVFPPPPVWQWHPPPPPPFWPHPPPPPPPPPGHLHYFWNGR